MSEVWPHDVQKHISASEVDAIRPFKCILLMPFEARFNQVAEIIHAVVGKVIDDLETLFPSDVHADIKRLDWVTSSGAIQHQIWREIAEADLVFCDITGHNPNVMFELGVCAASKDISQVVFLKDHFFRQPPAFDIEPIRYTEYELTSNGIQSFADKIAQVTRDVLIGFPDRQGSSPKISLPLDISFKDNRDDSRIYTPPFAHRRVIDGALEFGSFSFTHSWASIGKERFRNFTLEFCTRFSGPKGDAGLPRHRPSKSALLRQLWAHPVSETRW